MEISQYDIDEGHRNNFDWKSAFDMFHMLKLLKSEFFHNAQRYGMGQIQHQYAKSSLYGWTSRRKLFLFAWGSFPHGLSC